MRGINKRLAKVDRRIANIDRRIGFMDGRLYFQALNGHYCEVPIFEFRDNGDSARPWKDGTQLYAHRYSCKIDRAWWQSHHDLTGRWAIARDFNNDRRLPVGTIPPSSQLILVEMESNSVQDDATHADVTFHVIQSTPTYTTTTEPAPATPPTSAFSIYS